MGELTLAKPFSQCIFRDTVGRMSLLATEGIDRNLGVGDEDNGGHSERQGWRWRGGGGRDVVGWRERCFATPMRSSLTNGAFPLL